MHYFSFFFFFYPKPVLDWKNTGDRRAVVGKELPAVPEPLKTFYPYPNFQKKQQQLINLQHRVMVPKGTYAKHELIRQAGEL